MKTLLNILGLFLLMYAVAVLLAAFAVAVDLLPNLGDLKYVLTPYLILGSYAMYMAAEKAFNTAINL